MYFKKSEDMVVHFSSLSIYLVSCKWLLGFQATNVMFNQFMSADVCVCIFFFKCKL